MTDTITAYPLQWPVGRPRAERHERSSFSASFSRSREGLRSELRLLGARNPVISSNIPLRKDGYPYATYKEPDDPGVAVYFDLHGQQQCFACDRWCYVRDNLRSIERTINALRGIERWGSGDMVRAAFAGFAALPSGGGDAPDAWWTVLGVEPTATMGEINSAYLRLVKRHHPDNGGNQEAFMAVQSAMAQAKSGRMLRQ